MNMNWVKLAAGLLVGLGAGCIIGKRKVDELEAARDTLIASNKQLQDKCDDLVTTNQNLREANRWKTELMLKEAIVEDYDAWKKETENILAEEVEELVDEMSDEEYRETLAYIQGDDYE